MREKNGKKKGFFLKKLRKPTKKENLEEFFIRFWMVDQFIVTITDQY
jgi:hypothetical protein